MLNTVINEFRKMYGEGPEVVCSAPGRLDFLNTHQDYKGLPVVSVAINLRTYIALKRLNESKVRIASGNLLDEGTEYIDEFSVMESELESKYKWFGNYVRAAIIALRQAGYKVGGFIGWIRSEVPIAAGLGSSGTLLVSIITALNKLFNLQLSVKDIAELAYRAEHDVMKIPCGRLDQYASAFGGVALIETIPPYNVEVLKWSGGVFAVIDSGIKHSTAEIHPQRQREIEEGLRKLMEVAPPNLRKLLGYRYWEPQWRELRLEMLQPYLDSLDEKARNRIVYTIKAHRSTMLAVKILKGLEVTEQEIISVLEVDTIKARELYLAGSQALIGYIMTYQHKLLSDLYDVSLPELDSIVNAFIENGAYGAKLSGAGLGGCVIALFSNEEKAQKAVEDMLSRKLGRQGWVVKVDIGATCHM